MIIKNKKKNGFMIKDNPICRANMIQFLHTDVIASIMYINISMCVCVSVCMREREYVHHK